GIGVRRFTTGRVPAGGGVNGGSCSTVWGGGAARAVGTGMDPDFVPGIRSRESRSWPGLFQRRAGDSEVSFGSDVEAVAATGGGVEARSRRRSSAAEIDGGGGSGGWFGFAMRTDSQRDRSGRGQPHTDPLPPTEAGRKLNQRKGFGARLSRCRGGGRGPGETILHSSLKEPRLQGRQVKANSPGREGSGVRRQ